MGWIPYIWAPEIIQLTKKNFSTYLLSKPYILVNFYSPKCKYCRKFDPEYEKVAYELQRKNVPIVIGKLDATSENQIASEQGIDRYPTLKFFKHAVPIKYDGPREASRIINWLEKRMPWH